MGNPSQAASPLASEVLGTGCPVQPQKGLCSERKVLLTPCSVGDCEGAVPGLGNRAERRGWGRLIAENWEEDLAGALACAWF